MDTRPTPAELVAAVADFLESTVVQRLEGQEAFHARVSANVLRIVERELTLGPSVAADESARLAELPGAPESTAALAALIREGSLAHDDPALLEHLRADVLARMAIDSPSYPSLRHTRR